jgi:hypothetical protein
MRWRSARVSKSGVDRGCWHSLQESAKSPPMRPQAALANPCRAGLFATNLTVARFRSAIAETPPLRHDFEFFGDRIPTLDSPRRRRTREPIALVRVASTRALPRCPVATVKCRRLSLSRFASSSRAQEGVGARLPASGPALPGLPVARDRWRVGTRRTRLRGRSRWVRRPARPKLLHSGSRRRLARPPPTNEVQEQR